MPRVLLIVSLLGTFFWAACGGSGGSAGRSSTAGTGGRAGSSGTAGTTGAAGSTGAAGAGNAGTSGISADAGADSLADHPGQPGGDGAAGAIADAGTTDDAGADAAREAGGSAGTSGAAGADGGIDAPADVGIGGTTGAAGSAGAGGPADAGTSGAAGAATTGAAGSGAAGSGAGAAGSDDGGAIDAAQPICGISQGSADGQSCNAITPTGPCVTEQTSAAATPTPAGGTIVAGVYKFVSATFYGSGDAGDDEMHVVRKTVMFSDVTATSLTLDQADQEGADISRSHGNVTINGAVLTYTPTCPDPADGGNDSGGSAYFTATPTTFTLFQQENGGVRVEVYSKS